jgi:anti-sigma factor RsiW
MKNSFALTAQETAEISRTRTSGAKAPDKKERLFAGLKPRASTVVRSCTLVLFSAAFLAALFVFSGAAPAQQKRDDPSAKTPRTADGKPDMTGVWQGGSNRIGTWEEANVDGGFVSGNAPMTPFAIKDTQPPPPYQE